MHQFNAEILRYVLKQLIKQMVSDRHLYINLYIQDCEVLMIIPESLLIYNCQL